MSRQAVVVDCAGKTEGQIPKFCVATPKVLWAGSRPDKNDIAWLMQQGIRTVVDLELFHDDRHVFAHATPPDSRSYDVRYFHVLDWEPLPLIAPRMEDSRVAKVLAITSKEPAPVLIHCRCGMKRATLMIAAHRVVIEGMSAQNAIREMESYAGTAAWGGAWSGPDERYIAGLAIRRDAMLRRIAELTPKLKPDAQISCADGRCSAARH